MIVGIPREICPGERRVALVPAVLPALTAASLEILVEAGAGTEAGYPDGAYTEKGARIAASRAELFAEAEVVLQVRSPGAAGEAGRPDIAALRDGQAVIGFSEPLGEPAAAREVAERGATALSMELIPRITRAQSMDALSSMATIAGYKAGAARGERTAPHVPDDDDGGRHDHAGPRVRHRGGGGGPPGDRVGPPSRRAGRGLRCPPRGQGAGREPRRLVRRVAPRYRRGGGRRRLREGAGRVVPRAAARDHDARRRRERRRHHDGARAGEDRARPGDGGDGRRHGTRFGGGRSGRGAGRQLRPDERRHRSRLRQRRHGAGPHEPAVDRALPRVADVRQEHLDAPPAPDEGRRPDARYRGRDHGRHAGVARRTGGASARAGAARRPG